jgi:hypothetical protein
MHLYCRFLEILFVVSDHPSLIVSLMPATFWKDIFKHPFYLKDVPEVLTAMPAVLELATRKISKIVTATLSKENTIYSIQDFDGSAEYQEFSRLVRGIRLVFLF